MPVVYYTYLCETAAKKNHGGSAAHKTSAKGRALPKARVETGPTFHKNHSQSTNCSIIYPRDLKVEQLLKVVKRNWTEKTERHPGNK
jgi:hypothetical protein